MPGAPWRLLSSAVLVWAAGQSSNTSAGPWLPARAWTDRKDSRSQVAPKEGGGKSQVREIKTGERLEGMGISESTPWFSVSCEKPCLFLEELDREADPSSLGLWRLRGT